MIISHWGIFPGWFVPFSNRIGETRMSFQAVDFDTYCAAIDAVNAAALELAELEAMERRHYGRAFH